MNKKHMLDRLIAKHIWNPIAWSKHEPDANPPSKKQKKENKKKKHPKSWEKNKKQNQKTPNQYQYFHFTYYRH